MWTQAVNIQLYSIQEALFIPQGEMWGKQVCKHKYTQTIHLQTYKHSKNTNIKKSWNVQEFVTVASS